MTFSYSRIDILLYYQCHSNNNNNGVCNTKLVHSGAMHVCVCVSVHVFGGQREREGEGGGRGGSKCGIVRFRACVGNSKHI